MSGTGQRFLAAGYETPKPLIEVDGLPIIEHVMRMFPGENKIIFICNSDHLEHTAMRSVLLKISPTAEILSISPHKFGPVFTVSKAFLSIPDDEPAIISYCDYFAKWDWANFKNKAAIGQWAAAIPCYKGFHPHLLLPNLYAGVRTDAHMKILEVREKFTFTPNTMDTYQSSGSYYFHNGKMLKKYLQMALDYNLQINGEFYISSVFELILKDKLLCSVYPQEYFCQWGTPQDLSIYQKWSNFFTELKNDSLG